MFGYSGIMEQYYFIHIFYLYNVLPSYPKKFRCTISLAGTTYNLEKKKNNILEYVEFHIVTDVKFWRFIHVVGIMLFFTSDVNSYHSYFNKLYFSSNNKPYPLGIFKSHL